MHESPSKYSEKMTLALYLQYLRSTRKKQGENNEKSVLYTAVKTREKFDNKQGRLQAESI